MPSLFGRWRSPFENDLEATRQWLPSTDISETDKEYLIRAELPAVRKEDVRVMADDGMIRIDGERKHHSEQNDERVHRAEGFYGSFSRSFSLPDNVDSSAIRCESRNGVINLRGPTSHARGDRRPGQPSLNGVRASREGFCGCA
jgi:HSP20 family protein